MNFAGGMQTIHCLLESLIFEVNDIYISLMNVLNTFEQGCVLVQQFCSTQGDSYQSNHRAWDALDQSATRWYQVYY